MTKPIALAADHGGFELKEAVKAHLDELGLEYIDFGTHSTASVDYPDMALPACDAVVSGQCSKALLFCGTGVGISMAANKIKGIRACCCSDSFSCEYTPPPQRRQRPVHGRPRGGRWSCLPVGGYLPEHRVRGRPSSAPYRQADRTGKPLIEIFVISQRSLQCKLLCEKILLCAHRAGKGTDQYPIECSI